MDCSQSLLSYPSRIHRMKALSLYFAVWRTALVNATEYRINFFTNTVLATITAMLVGWYLWQAVYQAPSPATALQKIPFAVMQSYIVFGVIFFRLSQAGRYERNASDEIRQGDLNKYLLKPIAHWWYVISASMAERTAALLIVLVMVSISVLFVPTEYSVRMSVPGILLALPVLLCAMIIRSSLSLATSYIAFWIDEVWTLHVIQDIAFVFLAGEWGPLSLLPEPLRTLSSWLPFQAVSYVPSALATGMMPIESGCMELGKSFVWAILCFMLMRLLWIRGIARFGAYGG
jgi:ABC-2 type transport system permease protein